MLIKADKSTFDAHIGKPCIVDFFTTGCPSCEKFDGVFKKAAGKYNAYTFIQVDLDEDISLAERYGLIHVPTVMKFICGEPVKTATGYMDDTAFTEFVESGREAEK